MKSPAGENSSLPYLFANSTTAFLSWVEKPNDSVTLFRYSEMMNSVWQESKDIISGTDWFVNWADFPSIVEHQGNLFTHILNKSSSGTYSYDVKMNLKPRGGDWKVALPLHDDGTPTEHGFVTALPYKENAFFVTWLDGRNTEEKEGHKRGAMTVRSAEVSAEGIVKNQMLLDSRTCDCCQTTAAITANGPVVIYRDRSEDEIRDISIVRQIDGVWTTPQTVHDDYWKIKGCPVNGPKAAAIDNTLVVAWFTAAQEKEAVKVSFSMDGGATFEEPILIGQDTVIGRVDVALLNKEAVVVSYMETSNARARLIARVVTKSGDLSLKKTIAEMDVSRTTGFPQMELMDGKAVFAWTDFLEGQTSIKTAMIAIEALETSN